ncbi:MAG: amidohydrolase family protein [Candidatus Micrarchaeales archaeon]|nr:amidohydrolase family protein [Candidatus Micrarchaeales archaeon]
MSFGDSLELINGTIVLNDKVDNCNLFIKNGVITKIGVDVGEHNKIDASGMFVLPGLINSHTHLGETVFKNLISFKGLYEYIRKTDDINTKLRSNTSFVRAASGYKSIVDFIKEGITTICAARCATECDNAGLRSFSGYIFMKSKKLQHFIDEFNEAFYDYINNIKTSKLSKPILFLHSIEYVDSDTLELISKLHKTYKLPFTVHLSETKYGEAKVRKNFGCSSTELLNSYGLINESALLVHCCYTSETDLQLIKKKKANVILCPTSNKRLNNRTPSLKTLLKLGINTSIATDGLATNLSPSLLAEYKYLAKIENINMENKSFAMLTTNPAKALGIKAGAIQKGNLSDLILLQPEKGYKFNGNIPSLFWHSKIKYVIVGGKPILLMDKYTTLNLSEVKAKFDLARTMVFKAV